MVQKSDLRKLNKYLWEIPKSFRKDMRVPARIYASEEILKEIENRALAQLINTTTIPGIARYAIGMPDIHSGYGPPIGGVGAMELDGVISPGFVGFDQNCGMRLLKSDYKEEDIRNYVEPLASKIQEEVPSGLGKGRKLKFNLKSINKILENGAQALVKNGYGQKEDIEHCESNGRMNQADSSVVSDHAKNRGRDQVGTLGSGNHFCEVQEVEEIFDEDAAKAFGLFKNQVVVMIHTGSRGLGHQICTDYLKVMRKAMRKYNIKLPDKQLACAPLNSDEGKRFFKAMSCGANYAWANRQMITHFVRKAWQSVLEGNLSVLYDVAHNIAKIEEHEVNGKKMKLCVHRKGATRAFPPGHSEIPKEHRSQGQVVLLPGSMGTASYVCAGTEKSKEAWYTTCHGSGRTMSRKAATRKFPGRRVVKELEKRGITIKCHSMKGIAEEASGAYKNINDVVEVVHNAGLAKKVAKLKPLAVVKGE